MCAKTAKGTGFGNYRPSRARPRMGTGGTYLIKKGKKAYVGRSKNDIRGRLNAHFRGNDRQAIGRYLRRLPTKELKKVKVAWKSGPQKEKSTIQKLKKIHKMLNKTKGSSRR